MTDRRGDGVAHQGGTAQGAGITTERTRPGPEASYPAPGTEYEHKREQ
ncbi:hypothetical protein OG241_17835 [Streptomyces sp. NBC_01390]